MITNKAQMISLLRCGTLGPALPIYDSLRDALAAGHEQLGARSRTGAGPVCSFRHPLAMLVWLGERLNDGHAVAQYYFCGGPPLQDQRMNAELSCIDGQPTLYYSLARDAPMRAALANSGRHMRGPRVWLRLRSTLTPTSYEDMRELYDEYADNHVIEFVAFDSTLAGPGRNMLIWEIRAY